MKKHPRSGLLAAALLLMSSVALATGITANAAPKVTVVSVTTTKPDGIYKVGDVIPVVVTFSDVVTVSTTIGGGSIALLMETGPADRIARMVDQAAPSTDLIFNYIIQIGDRSSDLDVQSPASLMAGGYSIKANGEEVDLALPSPKSATSLSATSNIVIDGAGIDEQWQSPLSSVRGLHGFNIAENRRDNVSYVGVTPTTGELSQFCTQAAFGACAGKAVTFRAVLPMCATASQLDCIESVSAQTDPQNEQLGAFSQVFPARGNYDFAGSTSRRIPDGATSSVLKFPAFPHTQSNGSSSDTYLVTVAVSGTNSSDDKSISRSFFASITPITFRDTVCDERFNGGGGPDQVGFACMDGIDGGLVVDQDMGIRCVTSDVIDGNKDGRITSQDPATKDRAFCALKQAFPEKIRFTIKARLSDEPSGWLHGRMSEPNITFDTSAGRTAVSVSAGPVRVPAYSGVASFDALDKDLQTYFDDLCSKNPCRGRFPDVVAGAPASIRSAMADNPRPYSSDAFRLISQWKDFTKDTASALVSFWNVRTLTKDETSSASQCLSGARGVTGIVTTNATAYVQGPPSFDTESKTLKYEVAAPHYEKDGRTEFKGVYNLIVREDVAECLYGFSNAFAAPAPPEEFADESDPDVYVEEEPYVEEEVYAEEYPDFEEEFLDTDDGSYEMYEDVEYEELSLEEYVAEEEDFTLTEDLSDSGEVIEEEQVFEETVVASIDASIITELQKAATANTAIELANGWFKFSATNFTFSKPTVKVNFAATPAKVVACVSGSTIRYVKSIRTQCPTGSSVAKTAYCVKGKAVDAVVGVSPKCPKGTKVGKALKCAKGESARLVVALKPKCAKGWSVVKTYVCVKGNIARKVSAVQVRCANGFALAKQLTCVKGKVVSTVTAVKPSCPKGYKAKR